MHVTISQIDVLFIYRDERDGIFFVVIGKDNSLYEREIEEFSDVDIELNPDFGDDLDWEELGEKTLLKQNLRNY
ncbi:hypothetical protein CEXT_8771 [Caerostris extrusa]|uniref:Uncharacterized protein n=1 Tax=Caerostris extrusa TaxID=172846 RepID=A0AAV4QPU5_CAEEX|nr:hypothetical protein CEXT_8771 [Caerostris extrusa]